VVVVVVVVFLILAQEVAHAGHIILIAFPDLK
jgi:hypothetical protein